MLEQLTADINSVSAFNVAVAMFVPTVSGLCSALASILPKPGQESIKSKAHKLINLLAFNFGQAKNK